MTETDGRHLPRFPKRIQNQIDRIERVREKKIKRCQLRKQLHKVLKVRGKND